MSIIEVYYDESLPIDMHDTLVNAKVPHILLHYVSQRRKGKVYTQPIGQLTLIRHGIRSASYPVPVEEWDQPTHKMDRELLPLMPAWVPIEMGKRFNEKGTFR